MTLAANGLMLTIVNPNDQASQARRSGVALRKTLNRATGKESTWETGFADSTWGNATRSYAQRASQLSDKKIDEIIQAARVYVTRKPSQVQMAGGSIGGELDERACLADDDDSESDADCKPSLSFLFVSSTDLCNQKCVDCACI